MPRLDGFEVLARLPSQPIVIFTTAYDQYALKAFGVNSVDYLLKPIEPESLERALKKVDRMRGSGSPAQPDLQALLKKLTDSLREPKPEYPERIASQLGDRLWFLDLARVTHFFAEDKLTYAVSEGKAYCVDYAITELEKKLDPKKFLRIHRSTMVNVHWIKEVSSLMGGRFERSPEGWQGHRLDRCARSGTRVQNASGTLAQHLHLRWIESGSPTVNWLLSILSSTYAR
jgi:two-component system, LytTR family, response regulator